MPFDALTSVCPLQLVFLLLSSTSVQWNHIMLTYQHFHNLNNIYCLKTIVTHISYLNTMITWPHIFISLAWWHQLIHSNTRVYCMLQSKWYSTEKINDGNLALVALIKIIATICHITLLYYQWHLVSVVWMDISSGYTKGAVLFSMETPFGIMRTLIN